MRYLTPLLAAVLLSTSASDAFAQKKPKKIDCQKDLKKAVELVDDRWSFKIFKPGSVDFKAAYEELAPAAKRADAPAECAEVLDRFMAKLHDGHSSLQYVPDLEYTSPDIRIRSQRESLAKQPGEKPKVHAYVVERDTTDELLRSILPGSEILEVDGVSADQLFRDMEARVSGSTQLWRDYISDRRLLRGPADTDVELKLREPSGKPRTVLVHRPPYKDEKERKREAEVYEDTVRIAEWKRLEGGWGYIRYKTFHFKDLEKSIAPFDSAVNALFDAPGLIIDLRGNGGGYVGTMVDASARFVQERMIVEYLQVREPGQAAVVEFLDPITQKGTTRMPILAEPRKPIYEGPLVILIDRGCFSACEGFTGGLQSIERAVVIGPESSGGGSGWVGGLELPSGAIISFSWTVGWRPDGQQIETNGVAPNITVAERARDWAAGRDRVLERAIKALEDGEAGPVLMTSEKN